MESKIVELTFIFSGAMGGFTGYLLHCRRTSTTKWYGKSLLQICLPKIMIGALLGNFVASRIPKEPFLTAFLLGVFGDTASIKKVLEKASLGLQKKLLSEVEQLLKKSEEKETIENQEWLEEMGKLEEMDKTEE